VSGAQAASGGSPSRRSTAFPQNPLMRMRAVLALVIALGVLAPPVIAQETRADTAAVLVETARRLAREGERDLAASLLRYVVRWYGETEMARMAARELASTDRVGVAGSGRTEFVVTNTLFGAWLGVVLPAALGANDPPPYGAGLIAGPGLGLLGSLTYSGSHPLTSGQSAAYRWSLIWSSWQVYGWRQVLGIGDREECYVGPPPEQVCYPVTSSETRWASLAVGGGAGIVAGLLLSRLALPAGDVAVVQDASMWGTWFGFATSELINEDASDDNVLTWMLATGNGFLLAGIPLARSWRPSVGRVRLITLGGLAGGLVGFGLDLLAQVDDERTAVLIPAIGSAVGLGTAIALTAGRDSEFRFGADTPGTSLLRLGRGGPGVAGPTLHARTLPVLRNDGSVGRRAGLGMRLLEVGW
jgi:hypothetical protein